MAERTPTTRDPGIATIFAIGASSNGGEGVVYLTDSWKFPGGVTPNVLNRIEQEVAAAVKPADFPKFANIKITIEEARGILKQMNIYLPYYIKPEDITPTILRTQRLTTDQIDQFIKEAKKISDSHH